ncbi:putative formin-like protein 6 isoform X2 [Iris pallida]|uniref:Formin-like protein 6 isoform X2 n=1 Tax=Iris pallida TaxID=29817 RepID=A0AAX6I3N7_IRIPA|nr:putative formin-like protein 6 isoform X2 [Iris pallida]
MGSCGGARSPAFGCDGSEPARGARRRGVAVEKAGGPGVRVLFLLLFSFGVVLRWRCGAVLRADTDWSRHFVGDGAARFDVHRTVDHRCRQGDRYGSGHGSGEGVLFSPRFGVATGVMAWRIRWVRHDNGFDVYVMED